MVSKIDYALMRWPVRERIAGFSNTAESGRRKTDKSLGFFFPFFSLFFFFPFFLCTHPFFSSFFLCFSPCSLAPSTNIPVQYSTYGVDAGNRLQPSGVPNQYMAAFLPCVFFSLPFSANSFLRITLHAPR